MVFLPDALKVKLGYDLSTSGTRNQPLHSFYQVFSKCRVPLNPADQLLTRNETGLASPQLEPALPLHTSTCFSFLAA